MPVCKQALHVKVGDLLCTSRGPSVVKFIEEDVESVGVFAPLTTSGLIMVNEVLCSCYAPPLGLIDRVGLSISEAHDLSHCSMAPLRWLGSRIPVFGDLSSCYATILQGMVEAGFGGMIRNVIN